MKAVLVIDVPVVDDGRHLCNECPIWNKEHCFCEYDFNMEAKGCPLKPMPKKKIFLEHCVGGYTVNAVEMAEAHGWNDCIEEILDETN